MMTRATWLLFACLLPGLAVGCRGSAKPATYPVKGVVTYRDQPLADADVTFMPAAGPFASGRTDAAGKFTLTTFQNGDGATAGQYTVLIAKKEKVPQNQASPSPYEMTRNTLPARYSQLNQSGLTAEVKSTGANEFSFKLTD